MKVAIIISFIGDIQSLRETLITFSKLKVPKHIHITILVKTTPKFFVSVKLLESDLDFTNDFRIVSRNDQSIYEAWNQAIPYCKNCDYITFWGAGDLVQQGFITKLKQIAASDMSSDLIFSKSIVIYQRKKLERGHPFDLEKFKKSFSTNHTGALYKLKVIEGLKFDIHYRYCADYKFILENHHLFKDISFIDAVVSTYPVGGISSSSTLPLYETFKIRRELSTISPVRNNFLFFNSILKFYLRKFLLGS